MKIALLSLVALFILSACVQVALPPTPSTTVEIPASTKSFAALAPTPGRALDLTYITTPTKWTRVYPTKKALVVYGSDFRNGNTESFIQQGENAVYPHFILYEDGQFILTDSFSFLEKHLSQAEAEAMTTKLEQLGFPQLQEAFEANPDSLFTVPADMNYKPPFPFIKIILEEKGLKLIKYRKDQEQYLIQPMQEIISYLNSFSSEGATLYQPDRLIVSVAGIVETIPEGETVIPWPEGVPSLSHSSYRSRIYLEGRDALNFYGAAGGKLSGYFSFEGKTYAVFLAPILPHECHIYYYQEVNLPPPAQPDFTCDD